MQDPLQISLIVTGIGMVALFFALSVLYFLMYIMTAVLRDRKSIAPGATAADGLQDDHDSAKLAAAAIAVALARAEIELIATAPAALGRRSSWRTLHHQRQLSSRLTNRKRP
jgi:Na+-transporting methylmalonyl-CoA/oxaloacetate decarboxylase gamma subunit